MKDFDLTTLRLFVAVCDARSIARVAALENTVPSAISKRLSKLESDLGTPLFQRISRGVHPTGAGQTLLEHARRILESTRQATLDVAAYTEGTTGVVWLIANSSLVAGDLHRDISSFLKTPAHAALSVRLEEQSTPRAVLALREGSAMLAVLWDRVDTAGLQTLPYRSDHLAVVTSRGHPLAKRTQLRIEECLEFEHIGMRSTRAVESVLERRRVIPAQSVRYRMEVSNFEGALRAVGDELGICIAPREVAEPLSEAFKLAVIPLAEPWAQRHYVICFMDAHALSPASRLLVDHLASVARAPQP